MLYNQLCVDLLTFLNQAFVIIGLSALVVGIATVVLAKRFTRVGRKSNEISADDVMYKTFKIVGLVIMLAGFITIAVGIITVI